VNGGTRYALAARRDPAAWATQVEREGHGLERRDALAALDQAEEMLMMGLRISEGLRLDEMQELTGYSIPPDGLAPYLAEGLLATPLNDSRRLMATKQGRLVLNGLVAKLAEELTPFRVSIARP
jgi:oxygen-independent coproporphyrinogen-3 oxidase